MIRQQYGKTPSKGRRINQLEKATADYFFVT